MKTIVHSRRRAAFTLTEMMVTVTISTMVICGVIVGHLVGLRYFQYTVTKIGGNDDARNAIARLIDEIRSAKIVRIGSGDASSFTECAVNTAQQGNSIQINATTDTNTYVRYFLGSDTILRRKASGGGSTVTVANFVTNTVVFTSENFSGTILTNNENNRVIGLTLQFYQLQYPIVRIGPNQLYEFYQVRTKVTRRALE